MKKLITLMTTLSLIHLSFAEARIVRDSDNSELYVRITSNQNHSLSFKACQMDRGHESCFQIGKKAEYSEKELKRIVTSQNVRKKAKTATKGAVNLFYTTGGIVGGCVGLSALLFNFVVLTGGVFAVVTCPVGGIIGAIAGTGAGIFVGDRLINNKKNKENSLIIKNALELENDTEVFDIHRYIQNLELLLDS